jgi:hypothetical protein
MKKYDRSACLLAGISVPLVLIICWNLPKKYFCPILPLQIVLFLLILSLSVVSSTLLPVPICVVRKILAIGKLVGVLASSTINHKCFLFLTCSVGLAACNSRLGLELYL